MPDFNRIIHISYTDPWPILWKTERSSSLIVVIKLCWSHLKLKVFIHNGGADVYFSKFKCFFKESFFIFDTKHIYLNRFNKEW